MNQAIATHPDPPTTSTKEKILDAAERLFAEHGFDATSHRMITSAAGVNLAAVNYHFRSKEALLEAVVARRIGPLNRKRLELLDAFEAAGNPKLEDIIRAFVEPVLRLREDPSVRGTSLPKLLGRMYVEPQAKQLFLEHMREVARRFTAAFRRALPELPQVELLWRMHFGVGVMAHTLAGTDHLRVLSGGLCDPSDVDGTTERMVAYLAGGLRAPVPTAKRG